jgi:hypothetical protein
MPTEPMEQNVQRHGSRLESSNPSGPLPSELLRKVTL